MMRSAIENKRRRAARAPRRPDGRPLILMYHRIAEPDSDPWALSVTPAHFGEQLDALRRRADPMSLARLVRHLEQGTLPRRAVVITFDDGYADNLHNGGPLLDRHDVRATIFLVSGYVDSPRELWWDELDRLFLRAGELPRELRVDLDGEVKHWDLSDMAVYSDEDAKTHREWRAWQAPPTVRHAAYRELWERLRPLSHEERQRHLGELRSWANVGAEGRPSHRTLTSREVQDAAPWGLFEFGCHTVTHPRLSSLSEAQQCAEVRESKASLEALIGRPIRNFAYPYGSDSDFTAYTSSVVRECGFASACSTIPGAVRSNHDLFRLPRRAVEDWNGDEFERKLSEWLA